MSESSVCVILPIFYTQEAALFQRTFQFLQKFLFFKDARQLLLRPQNITIQHQNNRFNLTAQCAGEKLDPQKHDLLTDVKAVTLHRFRVEQIDNQWHTTVILDV